MERSDWEKVEICELTLAEVLQALYCESKLLKEFLAEFQLEGLERLAEQAVLSCFCLRLHGKRVFQSPQQVLEQLTLEQQREVYHNYQRQFLQQWTEQSVNSSFEEQIHGIIS